MRTRTGNDFIPCTMRMDPAHGLDTPLPFLPATSAITPPLARANPLSEMPGGHQTPVRPGRVSTVTGPCRDRSDAVARTAVVPARDGGVSGLWDIDSHRFARVVFSGLPGKTGAREG